MSSIDGRPLFLRSVFPEGIASSAVREDRPFVTLTYAQSLDGAIAAAGGKQVLLSGKESMVMTHWLRTMHDGILVGAQTVANDDPQLNTRHLPPRETPYPQPQPIILDNRLRTRPTCKLLTNFHAGNGRAPWIITGRRNSWPELHSPTEAARDARRCKLQEAGAIVLEVAVKDRTIDIQDALRTLAERGIRSVMVEGGAKIISAFLTHVDHPAKPLPDEYTESGSSAPSTPMPLTSGSSPDSILVAEQFFPPKSVVDMHIVTVAPTYIGSSGILAVNPAATTPVLEPIASAMFGRDAVFASKMTRPAKKE